MPWIAWTHWPDPPGPAEAVHPDADGLDEDRAMFLPAWYIDGATPREPLAASAMELEIRNADLIPSAVPDTPAAADRLEAFALSFDGYAHWGDRCGSLAEAAAAAFHARRSLPDDLSDLRACLFYESQRWRWQPAAAGDAGRAYVQALLDAIRNRISAPALGRTGFASFRTGSGAGAAGTAAPGAS